MAKPGDRIPVAGLDVVVVTVDEPQAMPQDPIPTLQPGSNAPPARVHNGTSYWIRVSAQTDGSFTVTNARNRFGKTYADDARR